MRYWGVESEVRSDFVYILVNLEYSTDTYLIL